MLGASGLAGGTGDGGRAVHEGGGGGGGGDVAMGSSGGGTSSIMAGIGGDEKGSGGGGGGAAGEVFEGDRSAGGNRWPRQETIALLKIRSDMDIVFRDSSLKGPLWEEVSRKMAELGYHRSAKKCKEKFENVYKYHKRTKEGRVGKADGKTYRFFDQLEALEQHHHHSPLPPLPPPRAQPQQAVAADAVPVTMVMPAGTSSVTVPSSLHPISVVHVTSVNPQQHIHMNPTHQIQPAVPLPPQQAMPVVHPSPIQMENSTPSSPSATATPSISPSSSSTSSDEELLGRQRKRKRKWKDFFERLMREVMDKQEELQKRFLEAVEKREHDRMAREEAWKMQEMDRLNREHDLLVQERSMAAAKDSALISFLRKLSDQQQIPFQLPVQIQTQTQIQTQPQTHRASPVVPTATTNQSQPQPQPPPPQPQPQTQVEENPVSPPSAPQPVTQLPPQQPSPPAQQAMVVVPTNNIISTTNMEVQKTNGNGDNHNHHLPVASSSRWPKAEVQALIDLRTSLDQKYQENGPKGPLWEEISAAMKKLGYNRNPKRCKEKWENINKYFKKVKESHKKRPEDSKTCPYFHQLDALYREKNKLETTVSTNTNNSTYNPAVAGGAATYTVAPIMAQTEQQWPIQPSHQDDPGSNNSDDDDDEEENDEDQGSGYEIVANNTGGSMAATTTTTATAG